MYCSPDCSPHKKTVMKKSPDVSVVLEDPPARPTPAQLLQFADWSAVKCKETPGSVKTPDLEQFLAVPWEVRTALWIFNICL